MLSETEKIKCRSLLERLSDEQLESLCNTITNRQITAETRNDKIREILNHSISAAQLLKRKKIKCDDLFQYLSNSGISVSKHDKKPALMQKVLQLWDQEDAAVQAQLQQPEQNTNTVTNLFENLNIASQQQSSQPGAPTASDAASSAALQLQEDMTQHTSQVYNQSPTVSDIESEMDESITNYGAGAISQVTSPVQQNQVQHTSQNVSFLVSTTGNSITMTLEQKNDLAQMSVQSNLTTNIGITNLTSPPTTMRPTAVSTPKTPENDPEA